MVLILLSGSRVVGLKEEVVRLSGYQDEKHFRALLQEAMGVSLKQSASPHTGGSQRLT